MKVLNWLSLAILDGKKETLKQASINQRLMSIDKCCPKKVSLFAHFPLGESTFVENVGQVGELMLNGV